MWFFDEDIRAAMREACEQDVDEHEHLDLGAMEFLLKDGSQLAEGTWGLEDHFHLPSLTSSPLRKGDAEDPASSGFYYCPDFPAVSF